jgi:putative ABC transport system permease protein
MTQLDAFLARKNLRADPFGTISMILGVALGTATVSSVLTLDLNTRAVEARSWTTNPSLGAPTGGTIELRGLRPAGTETRPREAVEEETHEDYQVMRSAIRLGSLSAFLVGALIVFFTFAVVVERRRREVALLRSLGATPGQIGRVLLREALVVGVVGAVLGFVLTPPLSILAAVNGITTTGRARISWLYFPWKKMIAVSAIGALTAVLGAWRPMRELMRLPVARTLRGQGETPAEGRRRRTSGLTLVTLPFGLLLYVLIRPFFREVLPSLAFFVVEAVLVLAALLALLLLVPELVRVVGAIVARVFLRGPAAERLLVLRRIQNQGDELAWSIGGVMMVFALLLSLHVSTHALKDEVRVFGERAVAPFAFVYTKASRTLPARFAGAVPDDVVAIPFSARTPWPNALMAVERDGLAQLAAATLDPTVVDVARRFGPGTIVLSRLLGERLAVRVGDRVEVRSGTITRSLEVIEVGDRLGYVPMYGPYRNSKTYGLVSQENFDLLAPFAADDASLVLAPRDPSRRLTIEDWFERLRAFRPGPEFSADPGLAFIRGRVAETDRDFVIFDVILALTTLLAAVGITNQLVLSVHGRRRELALYRVLGMVPAQVRRVLLLEGAFIGLFGGALAVLLGVPLGWASIAALSIVSTFEVHFVLPPHYVLLTLIGSVAVSMLAAVYPALEAGRLRAAEQVHHE